MGFGVAAVDGVGTGVGAAAGRAGVTDGVNVTGASTAMAPLSGLAGDAVSSYFRRSAALIKFESFTSIKRG